MPVRKNGLSVQPGYREKKRTLNEQLVIANKDRDRLYTEYMNKRLFYNSLVARNILDKAAWQAAKAAQIALGLAEKTVDRIKKGLIELDLEKEKHYWSQKAISPPEVDSNNNPISVDDGRWHDVTRTDFRRLVPPNDLVNSADPFDLPPPEEIKKRRDALTVNEEVNGEIPPCVGTITYRPLTFEMTVNTAARRHSRSKRSRVFRVLQAIGSATSFVTAIAVPGPGSDLPLGLEKYRNLFLPSADRLFPSLQEEQRQNLVAQTMKPIEEISYGSDITRIIYIPKKRIQGLVKGHDVRISQICPFYFKIEVAEIQSAGTVTQGVSRQ